MPEYKYRAKTKDDRIVEGVLAAETKGVAHALLVDQDLGVISVEENRTISSLGLFTFFGTGVTENDLIVFSRQLSVMVVAHLPVVQALQIISQQTQNRYFKKVINNIYTEVASGTRLSDALAHYPRIFDNFYVNMLKSGETSGRLDEVLNYLADQLEKDHKLHRRIKGALMYPIVVILAMIVASVVVLVYVIPRLVNVFTTLGVTVPLTTRILISLSTFIINFWWIIIIAILISIFILKAYFITTLGKLTLSKLKFHMPVFGNLYRNIYILQITQSLHTLLVGGVDLVDALAISKGVVQDIQYKVLIEGTIAEVQDGQSIAAVFSSSNLMPELVSNMLVVGEQTGRLDYVLDKVSDYYSNEIDATTQNIMTLIEPLVMIILGIGVGLMVSAVFLPLYTLPSF